MRIAVLRETVEAERRVAATPETVKKLIALGAEVAVEAGAGAGAFIADAAFAEAGAHVADRAATVAGADLVLGVQGPDASALAGAKPGAMLAAILSPYADRARLDGYAAAGLTTLAMEFMPRITRAQSMDVLSSQSNLAGYKAVIDAAERYGRAFPMMMTAAGTISAARVFVMGVGVAGLQAIATAPAARRAGLGDRRARRDQGADREPGCQGDLRRGRRRPRRGRGRLCHRDLRRVQGRTGRAGLVSHRQAGHRHHHRADPRPGRPRGCSSDAQVASMKPGSVIVDLAVESGGNVEGAVAGEVVEQHGVTIIGHRNVPSRMAADASALYARNMFNLIAAFWDKDAGLVWPADDESREGHQAEPKPARSCTSGWLARHRNWPMPTSCSRQMRINQRDWRISDVTALCKGSRH